MPDSAYPMLAVDQALNLVLSHAQPLPVQEVALLAAQGHILAASVFAADPLPPFRAAVKDGYAVVAGDGPGEYPVVGHSTAGHTPDFVLRAGQVAYITTGAPLPKGADGVVMVEQTQPVGEAGERVLIQTQVQPGQDVRPVGVDVAEGEIVLAAGVLIGPAEIGLLATVGADRVLVYPRPRVAILSTGDELVPPGELPGPGQIRDSNRAMLLGAVAALGGIPVDLGIVGDDLDQLSDRLAVAMDHADVLITSGGVSMGDLDLLKPLLEEMGQVHFGRLRMKPGKPCTFATVGVADWDDQGEEVPRTVLVFALPGNPVSSLVTFYLMAGPALRKLAGWPNPHLRRVQAHLGQPLRLDPERPEYHRAILRWDRVLNDGRGGYVALSTGSQSSSRLLSMRTANALLELPAADGELAAGAVVEALIIG
ncbi:MAG: hypothetical protein KA003_23305 [Caldilineaceae bacterium]|nr:hypothetical protein [Caldilineaceae bacterium]MBP8125672.1 hypothetical protein [Caldilineaceae bacterium]